VTIRWLWGGQAAEPSTCSATDRFGLPARQGLSPLVRVPEWLRAVLTLCGCGLSWAAPPLAPPRRGNQALAAGSETRRRSVDGVPRSPGGFSGSVCLRNSPHPSESRCSSCRERGSGALACRRAGCLGRGDVSSISISPSGSPAQLSHIHPRWMDMLPTSRRLYSLLRRAFLGGSPNGAQPVTRTGPTFPRGRPPAPAREKVVLAA
jgi:hypothetical protein